MRSHSSPGTRRLTGAAISLAILLGATAAQAGVGGASYGGTVWSNVTSLASAHDGLGSTYVAGYFRGTATFGSRSFDTGANFRMYVAKISSTGEVLWVNVPEAAPGTDIAEVELDADRSGNVYLASVVTGTAYFGSATCSSAGIFNNRALCTVKLGPDGQVQWARQTGTASGTVEGVRSMRVWDDSAGPTGAIFVYLGASVAGNITLGGTSFNVSTSRAAVFQVHAFTGAFNWVRGIGTVNTDPESSIFDLAADPDGDVYAAGRTGGSDSKLLVRKYDRNGTQAWNVEVDGTPLASGGVGREVAMGLARSGNGTIYVGGIFENRLVLGSTTLSTGKAGSLFLATMDPSSGSWGLAKTLTGSNNAPSAAPFDLVGGMAADNAGNVYLTGTFARPTEFVSGQVLTPLPAHTDPNLPPTDDIYVAKADSSLNWQWARAAGSEVARGSTFFGAKVIDSDVAAQLLIDDNGFVTIAGGFGTDGFWNGVQTGPATFRDASGTATFSLPQLSVANAFATDVVLSTGFVAKLDQAGNWLTGELTIGQPIPPPPGALSAQPEFELLAGPPGVTQSTATLWCQACPNPNDPNTPGVAFAIAPVAGLFKWKVTTDLLDTRRIPQIFVSSFPDQPQLHIGNVPVNVQPVSGSFNFGAMLFTSSLGAQVNGESFTAGEPGYSVLVYSSGPVYNPTQYPIAFTIARTVDWDSNDCAVNPDCLQDVPWRVGDPITDSSHSDPSGKNGYVYFPLARYDGDGPDRVHDRETRTGAILPVNEDTEAPDDDLVVVWYTTNATTNVAWPVKPRRYACRWPLPGGVDTSLVSGSSFGAVSRLVSTTPPSGANGVAVHPITGKVYWTEGGSLRVSNFDGSDPGDLLTGLSNPGAVALFIHPTNGSLNRIYWTEAGSTAGSGKIRRAELDGSDAQDVVTGLQTPSCLTIHPISGTDKLFWCDEGGSGNIGTSNLDGTGADTSYGDLNPVRPIGLAFGPTAGVTYPQLYWLERLAGTVRQAGFDGFVTLASPVISGLAASGMTVDANFNLYVSEPANLRIRQYNLSGSVLGTLDVANPPGPPSWYQNTRQLFWLSASSVRTIEIANQLGSEGFGQPVLDSSYPSPRIYHQPDPALPGYNPNDEHALFAPSFNNNGFQALFALRSDLTAASQPFTLLKYRDTFGTATPDDDEWRLQVYHVSAGTLAYTATAGQVIQPPYPLGLLGSCTTAPSASFATGVPAYVDHKGTLWARSAGSLGAFYFYPLQSSFGYDLNADGVADAETGACVPWLDRLGTIGTPIRAPYTVSWPANPPTLGIGETLLTAKNGLPDIMNQAAVKIVFDESDPDETDPNTALAQILSPFEERKVSITTLPTDLDTQQVAGRTVVLGNTSGSVRLAYDLRVRLTYDPQNKTVGFQGHFDNTGDFLSGEPLVLPNIMSSSEKTVLRSISSTGTWQSAIDKLYDKTRNPRDLDLNANGQPDVAFLPGLQPKGGDKTKAEAVSLVDEPGALSAGRKQAAGQPATGFVTLAFNDDPSLGAAPVSLSVLRVDCLSDGTNPTTYQGQIQTIKPDNVFDEQLTLRHSGDFGGDPDSLHFQWYVQPADDANVPTDFPDPNSAQLNGWFDAGTGNGVNSITIGGASAQTISDNWYIARYRGYTACGNDTDYSQWAGDPAGLPADPKPKFVEGWIKRVVSGLNPFDQAISDFHNVLASTPNTFSSMLVRLGARYEGDIAMSPDPTKLGGVGLIAAYETALRRALGLSIDAGLDYPPANTALLNISSRLADFYLLLGNEAYGDAQDPTIGYSTKSGELGTLAPAVFAFENQLASLLDEELGLLRGRGQRGASPAYNRLLWNFTGGDGQVAYVQGYNVSDQDSDGKVNVTDAATMFPQSHGDAWGHYLHAMSYYYRLLRHPNFTWLPRPEFVNVAGQAIQVDYFDERKFARAAAAKARAGAEILDLTYRLNYVEDPAGQWQGYKDTDPTRAWGVQEWSLRAGQAAYLDWAVANAILPAADPNDTRTGLQKVDRLTVTEIAEISAHHAELQQRMDKADQGLNPVGVAKGAVSFDIDPSLLLAVNARSHFEQVYERAVVALRSAVKTFDNANQLSQMLRRNQDSVDDFRANVQDQERDLRNRLIELFGTPYPDDIGAQGTYPTGYDGADFYHFMVVEPTELTGSAAPVQPLAAYYAPTPGQTAPDFFFGFKDELSDVRPSVLTVTYSISADGTGVVKPPQWTGRRKSPGEIQRALSDFYRARADYQRSVQDYDALLAKIEDQAALMQLRYATNLEEISVLNKQRSEVESFNKVAGKHKGAANIMRGVAKLTLEVSKAAVSSFPRVVGVAYDSTSLYRSALKYSMIGATIGLEIGAAVEDSKGNRAVTAKEYLALDTNIELQLNSNNFEEKQALFALQELARTEPGLRLAVYNQREVVRQAMADYFSKLAEGERLIQDLVIFRQRTAAEVSDYRYQDMAFRVFRNDALQKYRAAFDLAARYAYLAATAYDYETNLLGSSTQAGRRFLTDIVKFRSLGQLIDGEPIAGSRGLADPLARLKANFDVLEGQLGFNNPQVENNGFSLREEMLRVLPHSSGPSGTTADLLWRQKLQSFRVEDLRALPEFKKYCRPFAPDSAGAQPGLVIPFSTTATYAKNFFGWPLGAGDSFFDATHFATKVRSAGLALEGYDTADLAATPRVYLVPVGMDVMRSPTGDTLATREFKVVDQAIPPPFPVGDTDLANPDWIPRNDSLPESLGSVRRYATFKAFPDPDGNLDPLSITTENRIVGRSVWNTRWLLIIPGATLLANPDAGLDTFIHGALIPGSPETRDGNGVQDIRLFFTTYAYTGQ